MKDMFIYGLIILLPSCLSGQSDAINMIAGIGDMPSSEIVLEPSYGSLSGKLSLSIYPKVIKEAQVFILYFDQKIEGPYHVELKDDNGDTIEVIYNSKLSVFKAKSSLNLTIQTPLGPGVYHVVLYSEDFSQATKILKFGSAKDY